MNYNISQILIRTLLRKGLQEMQDSPDRAVRKLVDMAVTFSGDGFRQMFFTTIQKMLEDPSSEYYTLARNMAAHTDPDRLITFGMNIGFHACTMGAEKIRSIEAVEGYEIPWCLALELPTGLDSPALSRHSTWIDQGQELGIYCWFLFPEDSWDHAFSLVRQHPEVGFIVACPNNMDVGSFLDAAADCKNVMAMVWWGSGAHASCLMLQEAGIPYSVCRRYDSGDLSSIRDESFFRELEALEPAFSVLIPLPECDPSVRSEVYGTIRLARASGSYRTVLWDFLLDSIAVDSVISANGCWAGFDHNGIFHRMYADGTETHSITGDLPLTQILSA